MSVSFTVGGGGEVIGAIRVNRFLLFFSGWLNQTESFHFSGVFIWEGTMRWGAPSEQDMFIDLLILRKIQEFWANHHIGN